MSGHHRMKPSKKIKIIFHMKRNEDIDFSHENQKTKKRKKEEEEESSGKL